MLAIHSHACVDCFLAVCSSGLRSLKYENSHTNTKSQTGSFVLLVPSNISCVCELDFAMCYELERLISASFPNECGLLTAYNKNI